MTAAHPGRWFCPSHCSRTIPRVEACMCSQTLGSLWSMSEIEAFFPDYLTCLPPELETRPCRFTLSLPTANRSNVSRHTSAETNVECIFKCLHHWIWFWPEIIMVRLKPIIADLDLDLPTRKNRLICNARTYRGISYSGQATVLMRIVQPGRADHRG